MNEDDQEQESEEDMYAEENRIPKYNTGLDQVNRLNWTLWQINEAFRLKDYEMSFRLLDILVSELVSELKETEFDSIMDTRDKLVKLKEEYDVYNGNFQRFRDKHSVYLPPKEYTEELFKFNITLRKWLKKKGLGMPTSGEFDMI